MPRAEYAISATVSPGTAHKRRYREATRNGSWQPYVDPTAAMNRLVELRTAGWSRDALHDLTGISVICIERLVGGQRGKIRPTTERLVLRADLDPRRIRAHLLISALGTQRRLGALAYLGWSYKDLSQESGLGWTVFERAMNRTRVNAGLASAVADMYDRLWRHVGPTPRVATVAKKFGRVGPLAWDDDLIDEPGARPLGVQADRARLE